MGKPAFVPQLWIWSESGQIAQGVRVGRNDQVLDGRSDQVVGQLGRAGS